MFAVCALSAWLELEVCREGRRFSQRFERGVAVSKLCETGVADTTGTRVVFAPDPDIFSTTGLDAAAVMARLSELSYLFPQLILGFKDLREHHFHQPGGLAAYVQASDIGSGMPCGEEPVAGTFICSFSAESIRVEVAARWCASRHTSLQSFANVARTTDGGTHVEGLLRGLASGARKALPEACLGLRRSDIVRVLKQGLNAVVCVRLDDPSYGRPTRDRLSSAHVAPLVERGIAGPFADFLRSEPALSARIGETLQCLQRHRR